MAAREQVWVRVATDIDPKVYKKLKAKAESEHRKVAAEIRVAIDKHLADNE